ncbi:MAG: response regulator [Candidatus Moranbacteria bacterium]|nr:response regulator [Candidatus Moranbacteria bacterium]
MTKLKKIIIVDDDIELREIYAEIFQNNNFEVLQACDGVEGLDLVTKELPDIIFTGIVMPRMDGFSMIEALQKNVATSNIPVVISSHMGREEDRIKAGSLGVKDFIIRGTTVPIEVLDRINVILLNKAEVEHKLDFDAFSADAQKLNKEINAKEGFKCLNCDEKLSLSLQFNLPMDGSLKARFICPKCGREAK